MLTSFIVTYISNAVATYIPPCLLPWSRDFFSKKLRFPNEFLKMKYIFLNKKSSLSIGLRWNKIFCNKFYMLPSVYLAEHSSHDMDVFHVPFCWRLQSNRGQVTSSKGNTSCSKDILRNLFWKQIITKMKWLLNVIISILLIKQGAVISLPLKHQIVHKTKKWYKITVPVQN